MSNDLNASLGLCGALSGFTVFEAGSQCQHTLIRQGLGWASPIGQCQHGSFSATDIQ
jgi:hypothetical protein